MSDLFNNEQKKSRTFRTIWLAHRYQSLANNEKKIGGKKHVQFQLMFQNTGTIREKLPVTRDLRYFSRGKMIKEREISLGGRQVAYQWVRLPRPSLQPTWTAA
jgi:hypothetical protein